MAGLHYLISRFVKKIECCKCKVSAILEHSAGPYAGFGCFLHWCSLDVAELPVRLHSSSKQDRVGDFAPVYEYSANIAGCFVKDFHVAEAIVASTAVECEGGS